MPKLSRLSFALTAALSAWPLAGSVHAGASLPAPKVEAPGSVASGQLESGEVPRFEGLPGRRHPARVAPLESHPYGRSYGGWVVA
jgi:hypothetical protein